MTGGEKDSLEGREEGKQGAIIHEGAEPDPEDSNESADDRVRIVEPDGSPSPRAG